MYYTAHSSKSSVALPTSQLILQPFRCFTYVTAHSPTLLLLLLRHRLFTYVTWRAHDDYQYTINQSINHSVLPKGRSFTYVTTYSPQPFRRFTYVTVHSPTLLPLLLRHKLFT